MKHYPHEDDTLTCVEQIAELKSLLAAKDKQIAELQSQRDHELGRLAAVGVAAMEGKARWKGCHEDYNSASLQDVLRLSERCEAAESLVAQCNKETEGLAGALKVEKMIAKQAIDSLAQAENVIEAAKNLCPSEPSFDDERLDYVEVQIDREYLKQFRAAVASLPDRTEGK